MPTYTYGKVENGAIVIHEQECSYQITAAELLEQIRDLKASHNQYSDEAMYQSCLGMLEGALTLLRLQENAPLQDLRQ